MVLKIESAKKSGSGNLFRRFYPKFRSQPPTQEPEPQGGLTPDAQPLTASLQVTLRLKSTLLGAFVVSRRIRFG